MSPDPSAKIKRVGAERFVVNVHGNGGTITKGQRKAGCLNPRLTHRAGGVDLDWEDLARKSLNGELHL